MRRSINQLVLALYALGVSGLPIAAHLAADDACAHAATGLVQSHTHGTNSDHPQTPKPVDHDPDNCAICYAFSIAKQAVTSDAGTELALGLVPLEHSSPLATTAPIAEYVSPACPRGPPLLG